MPPNPPAVDPIELELVRNLFEAAAEGMGLTLQRTAFSANIKERRDFSCALFDAAGELVAQAAHVPVHLGSMPASVAAVLERLGRLEEGEVAIVNDPYAGGTHLPDITLVSPIYFDQVLVGYAANRAHHADVGGKSPGSMALSTHIDEEGIRLEPSLLISPCEAASDVMERLLNAVRTPDERRGDLEAQIAANRVGAEALRRMVEHYGVEGVARYGRALMDYAESFTARAIEAMPDGVYHFEDVLDDDGAGTIEIAVCCTLTVDGGRETVDLTHSADAVAGCLNCPAAVARSAAYYCFGCLLPEGVPLNGGCFRPIDVRTRPGSVLHAEYPSAVVAGNVETSQRVVDVVFGCLAQAMPGRIPAASCGTMNSLALGGTVDGRAWTYYETVGGGCGAGPGWAGESAVQCHMTNTLNTPAEALEMQYPLRVRRFEVAAGTGGAGEHRGGDGIVREIEALADLEGTVLADRRASRPYGLNGGGVGAAGSNEAGGERLAGKAAFRLAAGQVLTVTTPGGGGWGRVESPLAASQK